MKIAICAYGTWALAKDNPPELILRALEERTREGITLLPVHTPVEGAALEPMLTELLSREAPDALIGIGLSAGSPVIRAETTAINIRDYRVPDSTGACPRGAPICDGPVGYRSDLPNEAIVAALNTAGIPARISHAAGTHCCNQMLYVARHIAETRGHKTRCGFIHVPFTHAHIAAPGAEEQPSMALETLTEALEITMQAIRHKA